MLSRAEMKKRRERILLERFIHVTSINMAIVTAREAPDFHCQLEGRDIGVELTEIFIASGDRADPLQAQEAIADQIVGRAHTLYRDAGGPCANVSVLFGPGQDLRRLNRELAAVAICKFVMSYKLQPWDRLDWHPTAIDGPMPYEVFHIYGCGVPEPGIAHWSSPRAGWVATLTIDMLANAIAEKSALLGRYTTAFSENWLLIVADAMNPSSSIRAGERFDASAVRSPFSRTYFFEYPERGIELGARTSEVNIAVH